MDKVEIINPNVSNLIESIRDIGYSFEIAVADIIDNSITADSTCIKLFIVEYPEIIFSLFDNGIGMNECELTEAMRLATKSPNTQRETTDLGRFGLGLKTSSFSQCKKLTVVSKKNGLINVRQWDLDYLIKENKWLLITPENIERIPFIEELKKIDSGTIVLWETVDRIEKINISKSIDRLRKHIGLVFHRFLDKKYNTKTITIYINNNIVYPFNPFNSNNDATQGIEPEKIIYYGSKILVSPYILPHHSKISQQEYELYGTDDGYIKSQGFYVYRENRLLIHGTWFGLHKSTDAHKLVRIAIDIPNTKDKEWCIDIKKSSARPPEELIEDFRRIITQVTEKGSRPYTGRGNRIENKSFIQFWKLVAMNNTFQFKLNLEHPLFINLIRYLNDDMKESLLLYLKGVQAYLPLEAIQSKLQNSPHVINQMSALTDDDILKIVNNIKEMGITEENLEILLKTEIFHDKKELLRNAIK